MNERPALLLKLLLPLVLLGLIAAWLVASPKADRQTVTALFPEAVAVYEGTDVRVLGVSVGKVSRITPAGDSVRVEMQYDDDVTLPSNVAAVIVTPTMVADRFVQLTPAYTGGEAFEDGGVIERQDTGVPVELDRVYSGISDLVTTLGPNGLNKDGALNEVLRASARALDGKGGQANQAIRQLSEATETLGAGSEDLFGTVTQLAAFTDSLAQNDRVVRSFIADLAIISGYLADERDELERAVTATARAVGSVGTFVEDNRAGVNEAIQRLTRTARVIASERKSLGDALRTGPVAIGNLTVAFNNETSTIGSRLSIDNAVADLDGVLCALVQQGNLPAAAKDLACRLFEQLEPVNEGIYGGMTGTSAPAPARKAPSAPVVPSLNSLMGGTP